MVKYTSYATFTQGFHIKLSRKSHKAILDAQAISVYVVIMGCSWLLRGVSDNLVVSIIVDPVTVMQPLWLPRWPYNCLSSHVPLHLTKTSLHGSFNPFRRKTPKYLFPRGNEPLLYHQIGNRFFYIFITDQKNLMFWVDKIKYDHLAILSNLKSCQSAPRIVIFNHCICCQFEDWQIISPTIIPMSHRNIKLWQMRANFLQKNFSFFWYIIQKF